MAQQFDVWLVKADTVYKGVPYTVATGWVEQGRLAADDKVRPSGVASAWVRVAEHPLLSDFLSAPAPTTVPAEMAATPSSATEREPLEPAEAGFGWRKRENDDDDEVDMIPLIDISLVLLIYFMMTATVSALSPVAVPGMKHAAELRADPEAFTVVIDKRATGEAVYSVRHGERPPAPEDNNLPTANAALARLRARLQEVAAPPEVRIACDENLPRSHVRDVAKELDRMRNEKRIAFYGAEVGELK